MGNTALHLASYAGNYYVLLELLKMGAKIDTRDIAGNTPIFECCARDLPVDEDGNYFRFPKRHLMEKRNNILELLRQPPRTYVKKAEKNLLSLVLNKLCEETNKEFALGDKKDIDEILNSIGIKLKNLIFLSFFIQNCLIIEINDFAHNSVGNKVQ